MPKPIRLFGERERILLESAQAEVFRSVEGGEDLRLHFFFPRGFDADGKRTAILFFHGGGFERGSILEFAPHALNYVGRGAVCALVEYRTASSHPDSSATDAIEDGRTAVQFVRYHAEKLHVDPEKIVVVGADAGATVAGCAAMNASIPRADTEWKVCSPKPNGAMLLSPLLEFEKGAHGYERFGSPSQARKASLIRLVSSKISPTLLIHGTADRVVPIEVAVYFAERLKKRRAPLEFVEFEGRDRNFHHHNTDPISFEAVLASFDRFLDANRFLPPPPPEEESKVISWREFDF